MFLSAEVTDFERFNPTEYISKHQIELYKSNKKEVLEDLKNWWCFKKYAETKQVEF